MKIAKHLRRARRAGSAVRIDQRLGIDLKVGEGLGMDIARGHGSSDAVPLAQQYPASLLGMRGKSGGAHLD